MSESRAQAGPTQSDYARAESMLAQNLAPLVVGEIRAHYWQTDDRLVIRQRTEGGSEYRLVDAQAQSNEPLFDSARLAELLIWRCGILNSMPRL